MDYITPIEWCMTVRDLRRALTRFHRQLRDFPQDAIVYHCDYLAHMDKPLIKCDFYATEYFNGNVMLRRECKQKKLSKKRIKELLEREKELRKQYKQQ